MKKRIAFLFTLLTSAVLFSGCSSIDSRLERCFFERSGISEDADYLQYQEYDQSGMLDEDGYYTNADIFNVSDAEETQMLTGTVHVTFAENRYLQISYYTDAEQTGKIDTTACYLNPGDSIYASNAFNTNPNSSLYRLSEFRIFEYGDGGERNALETRNASDSGLVYQIPEDYTGTELSILPIGEYPNLQISLNAYSIDEDKEKQTLTDAGIWYINETRCDESLAEISSIESYILKFDYDEEHFFYVAASPEPFTRNPENTGVVEFWETEPTEENASYSVELHAYLSLTVKLETGGTVSVNGASAQSVAKRKTWSDEKLRYGDKIVIETDGACSITAGDYQYIQATVSETDDGHRYTFTITQDCDDAAVSTLSQLGISVNWSIHVDLLSDGKYGTCTYKLDGTEVSGTLTIQSDQTLTATYHITDSNYIFAGSTGLIFDWVQNVLSNFININQKTVTIPLSMDMDNQTIAPDDWFDITEKGA